MKKLLVSLICSLSILGFIPVAKAEEKEPVNVYMFTKNGCSFCAKALTYFSELSTEEEYSDKFNLITLEVFDSNWNISNEYYYDLLMEVSESKNIAFEGTPYIVVGETVFDGFDQSFDEDIRAEIDRFYEDGYEDPIANAQISTPEEKDDTGLKVFIDVLAVVIVVGVVVGIIFTRLPKKTKSSKKTSEVKKEEVKEEKKPVKKTSTNKSSKTNKPKQKK